MKAKNKREEGDILPAKGKQKDQLQAALLSLIPSYPKIPSLSVVWQKSHPVY